MHDGAGLVTGLAADGAAGRGGAGAWEKARMTWPYAHGVNELMCCARMQQGSINKCPKRRVTWVTLLTRKAEEGIGGESSQLISCPAKPHAVQVQSPRLFHGHYPSAFASASGA